MVDDGTKAAVVESGDENVERGNWDSKMEFILSCLGYAIGIGSVWRFPYLCYRSGGGAFLVPYLIMLFVCGIPLFFMETILGQFRSQGCLTVYRISPLLKGAGIATIIVNFIVTSYYNVIIAYPLFFLAESFTSKLPWSDCGNEWNTENCFKLSLDEDDQMPSNLLNITASSNTSAHISSFIKTPADEYFHKYILQMSDDIGDVGNIVWQLFICNLVSWICVFFCIVKGVKSVGKVVYFTATFPFLILFVLFIRGVTLPGAIDGILFYITPNWSKLTELKVWADAAVQIFFSLGPGWGGIINMASYNKFRNNTRRDSIIVPIVNCGTSIFAGFVVFSVLGFMSHKTGLPVDRVATAGPGLAFVTYPEAITYLPLSPLWAVLFFLMLYTLGLDSMFVQIEAIISSCLDEFPRARKHQFWVTLGSCFIMFLVSLSCVTNNGMYVLQILDWYAASMSVILICLIEVFIVGWIYGCGNFVRDLEFMIGEKISPLWRWCWMFITPAVLLFIFITTVAFNTPVSYNGKVFPDWAQALGWCSAVVSMMFIPAYMVYKLACAKGTLKERFVSTIKPSEDWGPMLPEFYEDWKLYCETHPVTNSMSKQLCNWNIGVREENRSFMISSELEKLELNGHSNFN